ncbi:rRNA maturation RNase YbeY [Tropicibacter sp. Alg240-R139]|uniref:rRNA maturation RNase YbeY n=1 Tax=Tropicibacter sp. Alg240-R139 TaxID=2305991 RepID=UPI0013DEBD0C|nr:rRNA maturation RNase YbeY [Tropicibacter sp. Alg240-R139]
MLDIAIEDNRWQDAGLEALAERAAAQTLAHQGLDADESEISLLACDDDRIAVLNAEFRDKSTPTNVLSWPAQDLAPEIAGAEPAQPEPDFTGELALGDIAISYDTCAREAQSVGKPMDDHVTHLIVHGVLHLLGYDHIRDADATVMEALEVEILGKMGINNPYIE